MILTKLDVAKRQLESAIVSFLTDGDSVATHTVATAAHEVLTDLGHKSNVESLLKSACVRMVRLEKQREFKKMLVAPENYFKHADLDPRDTIDFNPEVTAFFLFDGVMLYTQMARSCSGKMLAFTAWFTTQYPDWIADGAVKTEARELLANYNPKDKASFLKLGTALDEIVAEDQWFNEHLARLQREAQLAETFREGGI